MLRALACVLALSFIPSGAAVAADGDAISVAVTVIHAREAGGGVAPELRELERYLVKSFPKHKSFQKLDAKEHRLAVGAEGRMTLANGAELVFSHSGWKDGFAAFNLQVGGLTSTVNVKDGGTFFQAGRGYEGGMIVLSFHVASVR